jgi:hypothetical protein
VALLGEETKEGAKVMIVGKGRMGTEASFDTQVRQELIDQRVKVHGAALLGEVYSPPRGPP